MRKAAYHGCAGRRPEGTAAAAKCSGAPYPIENLTPARGDRLYKIDTPILGPEGVNLTSPDGPEQIQNGRETFKVGPGCKVCSGPWAS